MVDDSVVIRRMLKDIIESDPRFEVAGVAANGKIAFDMVDRVSPDVITLDVEMPVMDGLETLRAIRVKYRRLPVIMFSTLTERGARATIDALSLGASDYVTKPANVGSFGAARQQILELLIPKMLGLCGRVESLSPSRLASTTLTAPRQRPSTGTPIELVAIGSSTGGPNVLAEILSALPADFPVPIVIAQHMPPTFTQFLASRLNTHCELQVREAEAGATLTAGTVWIARGDYHMELQRDLKEIRIALTQTPPVNSCRPSVDVLFRSVAGSFLGSSVLAVVLTGMGQDGLLGCESLSGAGAQIIVQDEATSIVWGMPGAVARAGLANAIVPQRQLAGEILRRVNSSRQNPANSAVQLRRSEEVI
jgi:two-component system chemotaxis response regulator CheB